MEKSVNLVAHRGYTLNYPENTLVGLGAAIEAGANFLEVDIQLSKDKVPFLFHDRDMQRLCDQAGSLHDYTASELNEFRASDSGRFGNKFADNPITTLLDLVGLMQTHPKVTVFIELKRSSLEKFGIEFMVEQVLSTLEPVKDQCVIISYSIEALAYVSEQYQWPIGAVHDDWEERNNEAIADLNPQYFFCDLETVPAEGDLKLNNTHLAVYECTDPKLAVALHKRGIEFVETFAIGEMLEQTRDIAGN
ncbi:MAG: glycerophosphodiester phosphodiesterase family protein [Gammaproteobacteria bacterium]|nr:glycerophosphodiester phosphodiesterase family protein [Gammaproteobacteria bacterium]